MPPDTTDTSSSVNGCVDRHRANPLAIMNAPINTPAPTFPAYGHVEVTKATPKTVDAVNKMAKKANAQRRRNRLAVLWRKWPANMTLAPSVEKAPTNTAGSGSRLPARCLLTSTCPAETRPSRQSTAHSSNQFRFTTAARRRTASSSGPAVTKEAGLVERTDLKGTSIVTAI
jgi:hypothetical protein